MAGKVGRCKAEVGTVRIVPAGEAWYLKVSSGRSWQEWRGTIFRGEVWLGTAWFGRLGRARRGKAM